jgi:hypothetical protein
VRRIHVGFRFEHGAETVQHLGQRGAGPEQGRLSGPHPSHAGLPVRPMARRPTRHRATGSKSRPLGTQRLMGVEPLLAWVAVHLPCHGWVEFDPINDPLAVQSCARSRWPRAPKSRTSCSCAA